MKEVWEVKGGKEGEWGGEKRVWRGEESGEGRREWGGSVEEEKIYLQPDTSCLCVPLTFRSCQVDKI